MNSPKKQGVSVWTQQRTLLAVALIGFVGVVLMNRAVSGNVQGADSDKKPVAVATPASIASTSTMASAKPQEIRPSMPKPYQRYANNPEMASQRLTEIARETKGDWNKVSWDDQVFINRMTQGHGREMLQSIASRAGVADAPRDKTGK